MNNSFSSRFHDVLAQPAEASVLAGGWPHDDVGLCFPEGMGVLYLLYMRRQWRSEGWIKKQERFAMERDGWFENKRVVGGGWWLKGHPFMELSMFLFHNLWRGRVREMTGPVCLE
jgi:hypothetical protein